MGIKEVNEKVKSAVREEGERIKQRTSLIKRILMLSLLPVILLGLVLTGISALLTNNAMTSSFEDEASSLVSSYKITAENLVTSLVQQQYSAISSKTEVFDESVPFDERKELLETLALSADFKDFSIARADGTTYNDTDISAREYFQYSMENKTSYMSSPVVRLTDNSLTVMMGQYYNYNGQDYVIYGGLDVDVLNDVIKDVKFGETGVCFIMDKDGMIIATSDTEKLPVLTSLTTDVDKQFEGVSELAEKMLTRETGTKKANFNGGTYLFGYAPIEGNEEWTIAVGSSEAPIVMDILIDLGIFIAVLLVGIAAIIIIVVARAKAICTPIVATADRLRLFSEGDITSPAPVSNLGDETEVMTHALGEMCGVIQDYVGDIKNVLTSISEGDLTTRPTADFRGDFGEIRNSMELILTSLNETMSEVGRSAVEVREGAEQLSEGAQSLSQDAITQASAVDEITSTIVDIEEKTNANNNNVSKALEFSKNADRQAQDGTRCMQDLMSAIHEIEESSKEINNIIKVIDDIAFQTNILALNAAIEAARAGEAGKGFAVVADEVRNLAAKSSEAAQETGNLISKSIESVSRGTELAETTAKALNGIVSGVESVSDIMNEISKASEEQAAAIKQVTIGMENVNSVIHNTTATAEQSAAASEELNALAVSMADMVGRFKTNG